MFFKKTINEFNDKMNYFIENGNPEMKENLSILLKKIDHHRTILSKFFQIRCSDWYLFTNEYEYEHRDKKDCYWYFMIFLYPILDLNYRPKNADIEMFTNSPPIPCLKFEFEIHIPRFLGNHLDIPNSNNMINYGSSSWSIGLVDLMLPFKDERKISEQIAHGMNLNSFEPIFTLPDETMAYVLTKFENVIRYYEHLDCLRKLADNMEIPLNCIHKPNNL
jgi:hypothetical protein